MNLRSRYVLVPALVAAVFVLLLTGLVACAAPAPADTVAAPAPAYGQLPVMGYNTWYEFGAAIDESRVLTEAQLMVSDGLAAKGYDTMALDNGWMAAQRTPAGQLTWNTRNFPHGIPWLAARLHAMGLKLGVYTAIGLRTCGGISPGSGGHYAQDATTFATWGVDFVKVDLCTAGATEAQYAAFGQALASHGLVYSEEYPIAYPLGSAQWLAAVRASSTFAGMWRVSADESFANTAQYTVSLALGLDIHLHGFARPGHWNDLDMVVPGTVDAHPFKWTLAQEQAQLGVWAMEASPLLVSTNLARLTAPELAALENADVIGLDKSGQQSARVVPEGPVDALVKPYDGGEAVLLYDTGVGGHAGYDLSALTGYAHASYRNVWTGATGTLRGISATLQPGQSLLLVLKQI